MPGLISYAVLLCISIGLAWKINRMMKNAQRNRRQYLEEVA